MKFFLFGLLFVSACDRHKPTSASIAEVRAQLLTGVRASLGTSKQNVVILNEEQRKQLASVMQGPVRSGFYRNGESSDVFAAYNLNTGSDEIVFITLTDNHSRDKVVSFDAEGNEMGGGGGIIENAMLSYTDVMIPPVRDQVIKRMDACRLSIDVTVPQFVHRPIAEALVRASRRGVRVRFVLQFYQDPEMVSAREFMRKNGVHIVTKNDDHFGADHFALFDNQEVFVGIVKNTPRGEAIRHRLAKVAADAGRASRPDRPDDWTARYFSNDAPLIKIYREEFATIWALPNIKSSDKLPPDGNRGDLE